MAHVGYYHALNPGKNDLPVNKLPKLKSQP